MTPGSRVTLVFAGVSLALALATTWPLAAHLAGALPIDLGDPLLNAWTIGWDADQLRRGLPDLWNAPILYPSTLTLAFSEHLLGLAVPLSPVVWASGNPILAHNLGLLLTYVLAATSMFLLARFITGRTDAAIVAGLAFGFAPARADALAHLQVLASGWMVLALWGLHRYFATFSLKALAVFALAFVWQAYSNGYFLYFLALAAGFVGVFEIVARRQTLRPRAGRTLIELAAAAATILLLLAPIVQVYLRVRSLYGFHRTVRDLLTFSASVESYLRVAEPVRVWNALLAHDLSPELQLFPGATTLALATLALVASVGRRSRDVDSRRLSRSAYVWCYAGLATIAFVLSLGPEPTAWGHSVLPFSPYGWLFDTVPGFDGLRVPARLSVIVLLGLCVLAAVGTAWLIERLQARRSAITTPVWLALASLIVVEGWTAPLPIVAFNAEGRANDRPVYEWLAASPSGAVLELPVASFAAQPTLTYQYATLVHRHPIVNGYSGYGSALQSWLGSPTTPLNELLRMSVVLDALGSLGVRYVIVHQDDYADPVLARQTADAIRDLDDQLVDVRESANTLGVRLSPDRIFPIPEGGSGSQTVVRPDVFTATASDGAASLDEAFDNDSETRWTSGRGQRGDEWVRIDFADPTRVAGIRLQMAYATLGEYPRGLALDGVDDTGTTTTLWQGPPLALLLHGLLEDADHPVIAIPIADAPAVRSLVIRQTGLTGNLNWSIHELEILSR